MNVASDDIRNTVAESIGDFLGGIVRFLFGNLMMVPAALGVVALGFLVWRLSLVFGPSKVCRHCKGSGTKGGLIGGKRKCSSCGGSGLRPRVGSGGR